MIIVKSLKYVGYVSFVFVSLIYSTTFYGLPIYVCTNSFICFL